MSLPWESVATGGKRIAAPVCILARNDRARCKIPSILPAHPAGIVRKNTYFGNYRESLSKIDAPRAEKRAKNRPVPRTDLFVFFRGLHRREALFQVGDDVVDVLRADGQADGGRGDTLVGQILRRQLGVGGGGGVDDQTLHVGHVGQQGEDLQVVDEAEGRLLSALDLEGEDAGAAVGEVLLVQGVVGVVGQAGVVHLGHLGVLGEVLHHLLGVLRVALQAEGQGLGALKEQEGGEGGDGRALVPQEDGPDVGDKGGGAGGVGEGHAVVAGVGGGDGGIFAAGLPVELAGVHDHAAQGGAVAADELGCGVDHDVRAMLDGPDQVGGAEGVVHHHGQAVLVGDGGDGVNVGDVAVGVAQGLQIDGLGVGPDGVFHLRQVVGIHKGGAHAKLGQSVGQKVVGAAVDGLLGDDVVPLLGQSLDGIGDSGGAGGHGQGGHAALQGRNALFKDILGGVGQAAVNIARVPQSEAVGGVLGVMEHIGGGGVDGHRAGVGGGIGLLLTHMELKGLKFIITHGNKPLSLYRIVVVFRFQCPSGAVQNPDLLIEKNRSRRSLRHIRPSLKFALTSALKLCLTCSPPQGKENPCPVSIHMPHPFISDTLSLFCPLY